MNNLFESIMEKHSQRKIQSLCKKLIKKCSFNSGADARNLTDLAYWLFVYGYYDDVHSVYEFSTQAKFPGKGIFNVWSFLHDLWGLEIYLSPDKPERNSEIIAEIEKHIVTAPMYNELAEKLRRERIDFDFVSCEKKFKSDDRSALAMEYRIAGLQEMIGMTYIGIYPKLLADKQKIDAKIEEYLDVLQTVK